MNDISTPRLPLRPALAETPRVPPAERPALDVWLVLRRQKWPLVIGACLGLLLGLAHYATSSADLLCRRHRDGERADERPDAGVHGGRAADAERDGGADQTQVLRSLQMAEQVVRELDLHNMPAFTSPPSSLARQMITDVKARIRAVLPLETPLEPAAGAGEDARVLGAAIRLQRDLGITRVGRSFSIEVSLVHHDRFLAAAVANAYAAAFLADSQSANQDAAGRSASWLRSHIENVRAAANDAAREAAEFRAENRASDMQGLRELEQRAQTLNTLHAALLSRLEMITIEGSYPVSSGRLLSEAVVPRDPALPKAWRLLAAGLVLGLMGGMTRRGAARAARDGPAHGRGCAFGDGAWLPRLSAALPEGAPRPDAAGRRTGPREGARDAVRLSSARRLGQLQAGVASRAPGCDTCRPGPAPARGRGIVPVHSGGCAGFDLCRKPEEHPRDDRPGAPLGGQVIAVGSLNPKEGRTTVAANLAQLAALEGHRTLLIDADVLNPGLSAALAIREGPGLADVLTDGASLDEVVVTLPVSGLDVLPSMPPSGMTTLPNAVRMSRLLAEARATYDVVVVDSQPLGLSSDIKSVLASLDAVVIVADWGRTRREALEQYVANEPELAQKVAGIVLNRAVMPRLGSYGVALEGKRYIGARAFA